MYFCTQIVRVQRMSPNRIIAFLACLMTSAFLYADSVENYVDSIQVYRKEISKEEGEKRINLYGKIFRFSQETEDFQLQWKCLHDLLKEAQRQGNVEDEIDARVERIVLFITMYLTIPYSVMPPPTSNSSVSTKSGINSMRYGDY